MMSKNIAKGKENAMARAFQFDVDRVVDQLNRILQMELAAVIYYTHYSFMIYGHARIPITGWLRENATESLAHAQEAGQMIMRYTKDQLWVSHRCQALNTILLTRS